MSGTDADPIINPPYEVPYGYADAPPPVPPEPTPDPETQAYLDGFVASPDPRDPLTEAGTRDGADLRDAGAYVDGFAKPPDPRDPTESVITEGELRPLAPAPEVAPEPPATDPPVNVDVPYVGQDGALLACTMGNWEGEPTGYAYQWVGDGLEIGAGEPTYPLTEADVGRVFSCVVTASNAFGETEAPASNEVTVVAFP